MIHPIRIGVVGASVGAGWSSFTHLPALQALPDYDLVAVSTTRLETAQDAANKFGARLAFDNALDLVNHPDVDMVTVAVKAPGHREIVLAALAAGKLLYCEWPFGKNLAEATEMADAARANGVRTVIGLQGRASPWMGAIRKIVADGTLGEILSTSVIASSFTFGPSEPDRYRYLLNRENGVTIIRTPFSHMADSVFSVLGEPVDVLSRVVNRRTEVRIEESGEMVPKTSPDQITVSAVLAGGAVASLHMRGGVSRGANFYWEINGTEGDLVVTADAILPHMGYVRVQLGKDADSVLSDVADTDNYVGMQQGESANTALSDVVIDADVAGVPASLKLTLAYNVACLYAQFAQDIRNDTKTCSNFDDGVAWQQTLQRVVHGEERVPSP